MELLLLDIYATAQAAARASRGLTERGYYENGDVRHSVVAVSEGPLHPNCE